MAASIVSISNTMSQGSLTFLARRPGFFPRCEPRKDWVGSFKAAWTWRFRVAGRFDKGSALGPAYVAVRWRFRHIARLDIWGRGLGCITSLFVRPLLETGRRAWRLLGPTWRRP